jgi:hypothetical protein
VIAKTCNQLIASHLINPAIKHFKLEIVAMKGQEIYTVSVTATSTNAMRQAEIAEIVGSIQFVPYVPR